MNSDDDSVLVRDSKNNLHVYRIDAIRALAALGKMWQVNGQWHCDSTLDMFDYPELAVCDFCHERPVTWDVDCATFRVPALRFTSEEGWAACEPCGQAIVAGDQVAVLRRSLLMIEREAPGLLFCQLGQMELLRGFWAHYRGIKRYATPHRTEK